MAARLLREASASPVRLAIRPDGAHYMAHAARLTRPSPSLGTLRFAQPKSVPLLVNHYPSPSIHAIPSALIAAMLAAPLALADQPSPVTLVDVTSEALHEQAVLTGTSIPWQRAELSPRVAGLVTELFVDAGSLVEQGDPILALDAQLAKLEVAAAQAREQEAEAAYGDAVRVRDELLELKKGRHASETEIQSAIARVAMTNAALSAERATLAKMRELEERHRLAAPFAGMVVAKQVEIGEWVQQDEAAVELVAMNKLRIRATLPQRDYVRVAAGAGATVRFDALPDQAFTGEIGARIALGDERSRSFPLLIDLPNPDRLLAPGMSARVRVDLTGEPTDVLTVPRDAVVVKSDGTREVWRVQSDEGGARAWPLIVATGRAIDERVEIVRGELKEGDRVVLLGNERLRPGQQVAPQGPADQTMAAE